MKTNRISVQIIKSLPDLFKFTIDPKNTPSWIESITSEQTSEWPPKIGTVYKNQDNSGVWYEYEVTNFEENKIFELISKDTNFHVRYTCRKINEVISELEYLEWVDEGKIKTPFRQDDLNKLKFVLEMNTK